jgi:carbonic anhydrase/acetyltransferase-like protein (isoleucine patch superfamily)
MEPHVIGFGARQDRVLGRRNALRALPLNVVEVDGEPFVPHVNGGGLVALTATVDATVFVGPEARIRGFADVRGEVRLTGRSIVEDHAVVSGRCCLRDDARASENCVLEESVVLVKHAHIAGTAHLSGALTVGYFAFIAEDSKIDGSLMIE